MGRFSQAVPGVRRERPGRLMISGPSGAGKTLTGLWIAEDLADGGRILVVDTQHGQALDYAQVIRFDHVDWKPPFDPRVLGNELAALPPGDVQVVLIDSASHFWAKPGGTLSIADGRYTGWKEARPAQEELLEGIKRCPAHVIVCARAKMRHEQVLTNGKWEVQKLGEAPIQDDQFEYELDAGITLNMGHRIAVSKSRTDALPVGLEFAPGRDEVRKLSATWAEWLAGADRPIDPAVAEALSEQLNGLGKDARAQFLARFGAKPGDLVEPQADEAHQFVADLVAAAEVAS